MQLKNQNELLHLYNLMWLSKASVLYVEIQTSSSYSKVLCFFNSLRIS